MKVEIYQVPTLPTSFLWTSSSTSGGPLAPSNSFCLFLVLDPQLVAFDPIYISRPIGLLHFVRAPLTSSNFQCVAGKLTKSFLLGRWGTKGELWEQMGNGGPLRICESGGSSATWMPRSPVAAPLPRVSP
jgi:hypothetical protein